MDRHQGYLSVAETKQKRCVTHFQVVRSGDLLVGTVLRLYLYVPYAQLDDDAISNTVTGGTRVKWKKTSLNKTGIVCYRLGGVALQYSAVLRWIPMDSHRTQWTIAGLGLHNMFYEFHRTPLDATRFN